MSDDLRPLKLSEIKSFFSALSLMKRCAIAARAIMVFFCVISILVMAGKIGLDSSELFITVFILFTGAFFLGPVSFLILYWPVFSLLMIDIHLFRAYGLSLFSIGQQVAAVIGDTNKAEILEYVSRLSFFELTVLILNILLSVFVLFYKPVLMRKEGKKRLIIICLLFLIYPFGYVVRVCPVFQSKFSSERNEILAKAKAFKFNPNSQKAKADVVVVLIGESFRQAEFSKAFNKYASKFKTLYRFSDMISSFSGTLNTVPIILSRKKSTDYFNFFPEKSLFSLFKEAGYSTYFMHYIETSLELNGLSFIYREADNFIKYAKKITPTTDEGIFSVLDDILSNEEKKKLIVIKMIGAHIDFSYRYPDPDFSTFQRFLSILKPKTKEGEMFHYNKAVSYSAGVVSKIMEKIENHQAPSLLLFSSDHGICIFDKGYFHVPAMCQNAFHIPAMILLNPSLNALTDLNVKNNLACNQDKPLTEDYDFETLVSLAGISYPGANKQYDLTRKCDPLHGKKRSVSTDIGIKTYENL